MNDFVELSTREFSYNPRQNIFVTDASDIGLWHFPRRVRLISSRTKQAAEFTLCHVAGDLDEIHLWNEYTPTSETVARHPKLADCILRIFND